MKKLLLIPALLFIGLQSSFAQTGSMEVKNSTLCDMYVVFSGGNDGCPTCACGPWNSSAILVAAGIGVSFADPSYLPGAGALSGDTWDFAKVFDAARACTSGIAASISCGASTYPTHSPTCPSCGTGSWTAYFVSNGSGGWEIVIQ